MGNPGEIVHVLLYLDVLFLMGAYIVLNEDFIRTIACSFQTAFLTSVHPQYYLT